MISGLIVAVMLQGNGPPSTHLANAFDLGPFQLGDGAIVVMKGGNVVDPYFATKALLTAYGGGLDIRQQALKWVAWLKPRQRADGRFDRYCRTSAGDWQSCGDEDADDAMLALWIQLLYTLSDGGPVRGEWISSLVAAESYLDTVHDPSKRVYNVSRALPVALLMDNVEVWSAIRVAARARAQTGDTAIARRFRDRASELRLAIEQVFRGGGKGAYRATSQMEGGASFYPDAVAQLYPLLAEIPPLTGLRARRYFDRWLMEHGGEWRSKSRDYPWGLVAIAAAKVGRTGVVRGWLARAARASTTEKWNVLEEAVRQTLLNGCPASSPSDAATFSRIAGRAVIDARSVCYLRTSL